MAEKLMLDDLKVGDRVAVRRPICIGWSKHYRHGKYTVETITKITPRRAKFTTDKSEYEVRDINFYDPKDDAVWTENQKAIYFGESERMIKTLNDATIESIPDEKLYEIWSLLGKAIEIVASQGEKR